MIPKHWLPSLGAAEKHANTLIYLQELEKRLEALETRPPAAASLPRADDPDAQAKGRSHPASVVGDGKREGGGGVGVAEYPSWVPVNRNSRRTFDGHCEALGFQPTAQDVAAKMDLLDKQHLWSRLSIATRLTCEPAEALAWAYMGKCLGFLEYVTEKRVYRKLNNILPNPGGHQD